MQPNSSFLSPYTTTTLSIDTNGTDFASSDSPSSVSDANSSSPVIQSSPTLSVDSSTPFFPMAAELRDEDPESRYASHLNLLGGSSSNDIDRTSFLSSTNTCTDISGTTLTNPSSLTSTHVTGISEGEEGQPQKGKGRIVVNADELSSSFEESRSTRFGSSPDEYIDAKPFAFKPSALASLVDPKNLEALECMGGEEELLRGLGTHKTRGLAKRSFSTCNTSQGGLQERDQVFISKSADIPGIVVTSVEGDDEPDEEYLEGVLDYSEAFSATLEDRLRVYGGNVLPQRKSNSLLQLMLTSMKDKVIVLLSIAAVVSLALGIFQDFGPNRDPTKPAVDWVEGVAIIVAIVIVVLVGSLNDWQKEIQFRKLSEKKDERGVKVIRDGMERVVDVRGVLVGDIALLDPGEIIPCDGVILSGHNVKCDESSATGESDGIKKVSYRQCIEFRERAGSGAEGDHTHTDCFLISGSRVLEGYGTYVVIAVGTKSFNGRILMALRGDAEHTPLQIKLNRLAELIAKIGSVAGLVLFTALMIRFFVQLGTGQPARTGNQNGMAFVNILIISVTLIVVAVPEGLPLAVTLALAFATRRMTAENLLVRVLGSCETMADASVVCTDKTGTLTQNVMSIVAGSIGIHAKFVRNLEGNPIEGNTQFQDYYETNRELDRVADEFCFDQSDLNSVLSPRLKILLNDAIAINSTAFEDTNLDTGDVRFVGSKTETAFLKLAQEFGWGNYRNIRECADIVQVVPFSSDRKAMGVVVRLREGGWRFHLKGASEILAKACTRHVVVDRPDSASRVEGQGFRTAEIGQAERDDITRTIVGYANQSLRTIALCYKDFESWPPAGTQLTLEHQVSFEDLCQDLVLMCIAGIEDPLRPGVTEAVTTCRRAGVTVKMCTGDNIVTACSIATQCGIYTAGGIVMEGPAFRQLDNKDRLQIVPRLQVLARSSPEDKKVLVETLKSLGEIVGVTGDGTNDGPALKTAHVGFSMGISGTEVAKEASDIILMDDNFASIVKAIMWGRCVNDAVRKFLQFQITTNIAAVVITFASAVTSVAEDAVLSAVQLLWINLIMDTFAALALATDSASPTLLDRKPSPLDSPLFSVHMIKMIIGQSIYQVAVTLIFFFLGHKILHLDHSEHNDTVIQTLVFNAFVFAQIANCVNCRGLDTNLNILRGITENWYFILITLIEIGGQIIIVFVGGASFQVTRIGWREWGISLAIGLFSIPLGALIRLIPAAPCERLFIKVRLLPNTSVLPTKRTDEWNPAIDLVRDNLLIFASLRGGRLRSSSLISKSRKRDVTSSGGPVHLASLMTMVPTLVASSIGAGWTPHLEGIPEPLQTNPPRSSTSFRQGSIQVHPDTQPNDPAYKWASAAI